MVRLPIDERQCFWLLAEQARTMAVQMADPDAKRMMIGVAEAYEVLASEVLASEVLASEVLASEVSASEVLASAPGDSVIGLSNTGPDFPWWAFI